MEDEKHFESMATKLKAFSQELPEQERKVLEWLTERSSSVRLPDPSELDLDDLATAAGGAPVSSQLAEQFGLDGDSISVMWSHSFSSTDGSVQ
jgi:hypothetical protein